ncbi:fasciclin domain-containing protein [Salinibacter sp.]|uniref:fasciclin domain-containing protein n=1 Tax=Salinibacter sp. TaxID=2065818 RepID=UPI0021E9767B|nr:fasciclin domain-containing protein [Salinibacter sp.]
MGGRSSRIQAEGEQVWIGDATVRQTNLDAENGIVHVEGRVLRKRRDSSVGTIGALLGCT